MNILLAEDDKQLGSLLATMLRRADFQVAWVENGEEAYQKVYSDDYDVLVLDWMMPGLSGVALCQRLREETYQGKILLLTARDSVEDKVTGLDSGADDYLVKPFEFAELVARIRALARRVEHYQQEEIDYGDFKLNRSAETLGNRNGTIQLSPREFKIVDLLLRNRDKVIPREMMMERVWGIDGDITTNNLDAHIKLLRKKIAQITSKETIKTVRGVGYKIER
ncbi:MAG: response regulator transcription factor [Acidaminococcaceae bacterium]